MKNLVLFALLSMIGFTVSANAQSAEYASSRLTNLSNQLKRHTVDLSDRTYDDLKRGYSNSRREVETAFLAQQFDASAGLFQQMVRDNRPASELRDAAAMLSELARRAPTGGSNRNLWRNAKDAVDDIERELGGRGNNDDTGNNRSGRAYWRGMVDNKVQLIIRDRNIETRTIEGRSYPAGTFSFTSSLGTNNSEISVEKKDGRGRVTVIQQPSRRNNYTAIVEIYDDGSGARQYQLEISW